MTRHDLALIYASPSLRGRKRRLLADVARTCAGITERLSDLEDPDVIPCVGFFPELPEIIKGWVRQGREWIYYDRGYFGRGFGAYSSYPVRPGVSYWRWHRGCYQDGEIHDRPPDRWENLKIKKRPWCYRGGHIVVALPSDTYAAHHGIEDWGKETVRELRRYTARQIVTRTKGRGRPLSVDLKGAHALVTHGSIAAVESVAMGCPVFVDPSSAAAPMGLTDLSMIETPVYPERGAWLRSLAYKQFSEAEMRNGVMWKYLG